MLLAVFMKFAQIIKAFHLGRKSQKLSHKTLHNSNIPPDHVPPPPPPHHMSHIVAAGLLVFPAKRSHE